MQWSIFGSKKADSVLRQEGTWADLIEKIRNTKGYWTKDACPWVKMASFGDIRTPKGSLRHDDNVLEIYGVEGDYDDEQIHPEQAVEMLERAGIRALVYTSPSHKPHAPRWRVLCPLATAHAKQDRYALLARVNGALGGILAAESFTISQSYYFGQVSGNQYKVLVTFDDPEEGTCIDELDELDEFAIGKAKAPKNKHQDSPQPLITDESWHESELLDKVRSLGRKLRTGDGRHNALVRAANSLSAQNIRRVETVVLMLEAIVQKYFDPADPPTSGALEEIAEHAILRDKRKEEQAAALAEGLIESCKVAGILPADVDMEELRRQAESGEGIDALKGARIRQMEQVRIDPQLLMPPGILGEITQFINETARKPQPQFAVQGAIAYCATVLGRRFVTTSMNWPSLYLLNVGKSSSGKEWAKSVVEMMLEAAGLPNLIGPSGYTSASGVLSSLFDQPNHITIIDEFHRQLEMASMKGNPNAQGMIKTLIEVWGRNNGTLRPQGFSTFGLSSRDKKDMTERSVRNPAITLLAMTVPDFWEKIGSRAARDGFLNRFIIVESEIGRQVGNHKTMPEIPQSILEWTRSIRARYTNELANPDANAGISPDPVIVPISEDAHILFHAFEHECNQLMDTYEEHGLAEMFGRSNESAMKLALVLALGRSAYEISADDARWAILYVKTYAKQTVLRLIGTVADGQFEAAKKQVNTYLESCGAEGATVTMIDRRCALFRNMNKRQQIELLQSLEYLGQIQSIKVKAEGGRGRPAERWVAVAQDG